MKSIFTDYFPGNINILLNNSIEGFKKFLFISPSISQLADEISTSPSGHGS